MTIPRKYSDLQIFFSILSMSQRPPFSSFLIHWALKCSYSTFMSFTSRITLSPTQVQKSGQITRRCLKNIISLFLLIQRIFFPPRSSFQTQRHSQIYWIGYTFEMFFNSKLSNLSCPEPSPIATGFMGSLLPESSLQINCPAETCSNKSIINGWKLTWKILSPLASFCLKYDSTISYLTLIVLYLVPLAALFFNQFISIFLLFIKYYYILLEQHSKLNKLQTHYLISLFCQGMPQPQENYLDRLKAIRQKYGCPAPSTSQTATFDPKGYPPSSSTAYNATVFRQNSTEFREYHKPTQKIYRADENPELGRVSSLSRKRSIVDLPLHVEKVREFQKIKDSYNQVLGKKIYGSPQRKYIDRPGSSIHVKSTMAISDYETPSRELKTSLNNREIELKKIQELDDRICEKERQLRARVQGSQQMNDQFTRQGLTNYRASSKELDGRGQSSYKDLNYQKHYIQSRKIAEKPAFNEIKLNLGEHKGNYLESKLNYPQSKLSYPQSKLNRTAVLKNETKLSYPESKYAESKLTFQKRSYLEDRENKPRSYLEDRENKPRSYLQDRENKPVGSYKECESKAMSPVRLLDRKDDGWNMGSLDKIQQRIQAVLHRN